MINLLYPSIQQITKGQVNRYCLVIATAKCARHITDKMLEEDGPVGRRLDFLTQEINRECNTIGSKSSDTGFAKLVIEAKSEVEKIREQIQNIE